jgi:hypothetical protein
VLELFLRNGRFFKDIEVRPDDFYASLGEVNAGIELKTDQKDERV